MENQRTFIEENIRKEEEETLYNPKDIPLFKRVIRNRIVQGIFIITIFTAGVIPLVYWATHDNQTFSNGLDFVCVVESSYRVPCGEVNITSTACSKIACCYDDKNLECFHAAPSNYGYGLGKGGLYTPNQPKTPFGKDSIPELKISYKEEAGRFQVILHDASVDIPVKRSRDYTVTKYEKKLAVEVYRKSGEIILTTGFGPLIASKDYWEWTIYLTTEYLFGLGQLHIDTNRTFSKVFYNNENDHHSIPMLIAYSHGFFHGLVVEHAGPLEVTILPSKLILLKSLVGRQIVLNLFPGPTPKDVMLQQRNYVFSQPPNWMYEALICRDGGKLELSQAIVEYRKAIESGISYGIDCIHENLMMMLIKAQEDADTIDSLKELIEELKLTRKFLIPLTPHVPIGNYPLYNRAVNLNVLYKSFNNGIYNGKYTNTNVAYLDFSSPNIETWLGELIDFIKTIDPDLGDAIALLDNWPADEGYKMEAGKSFSYINEDITSAMSHTLPWNLKDSKSLSHMLTHNVYGYNYVKAIEKLIPNKPVITSSYYYGLNNPVVTRNINTTWTSFKETMVTNLYHSLFVHPLIASPVCGSEHFKTNIEEEVCIKWYFMAASMPLFYARKDWPATVSGFGAAVAKDAVNKRKQLVHYYKHFIKNEEAVSRPMFYDFYEDTKTFVMDEQYMIGDSLLIAHPAYSTAFLKVYLPPTHDWYEFWGGIYYRGTGWITIDVIETDWPVFIKSGSIVPLRIDEKTSVAFSLIAALDCSKSCSSKGVLQYEDSVLTITLDGTILKVVNILEVKNEIDCGNPTAPQVIKNVKLFTKDGPQLYDLDINLCGDDDVFEKDLLSTSIIY